MFWLVFLLTCLIDQLSKLMATKYWEVVVNSGVSFGWLSRVPTGVLTLFLLLSAMGLAYALRQEWRRYPGVSGLFWAGVVSNLLDRILLGGVIDWIKLPLVDLSNNLADIAMSLALLILLIKKITAGYED